MTAFTNPVSAGKSAWLLSGKLAAGFVLAATFASADEYRWGTTNQFNEPSYIITHPGEGNGHVATVEFGNRLNSGNNRGHVVTLTEGIVLLIAITDASGNEPDEITITPPEGYIAIPPRLVVPEDGVGFSEILEASEVPMS